VPGSLTLVCSEPGDFASALRGYGIERFLVTAGSTFRARLTQVHLDHIRLTYAEEGTAADRVYGRAE